jgi:lipopolysaccharide transport system permease protein
MHASDFADILSGLRQLRMAFWLAHQDMRARYTRTALGPWWNVLSTVIFVGALGVTFGALFGQPIKEFLPYIAASLAAWNFINSTIVDSPLCLVRGASLVTSYPLPLSTMVFRSIADKLTLMAHFLVVYVLLVIVVHVPITLQTLIFFVPAVAIYSIAGVGITLALSVLGARFRDISPALNSIMILAFLMTPIFWKRGGMGSGKAWIVDYNPFYHLIEIGRRPLLGQYAEAINWIVSLMIAVALLIVGAVVFASMRRRIYYWI